MTARLPAALALLVLSLAVHVPPAAASCAADILGALEEDQHDVAFVGLDQRRVVDGDRLIVRFRVQEVHRGDVRRTQDVVVPNDESSAAGVDWEPGDRVLVLADVGEGGRVSTNYCLAAPESEPGFDQALAQLGEGTEPQAGVDRIEPEGISRRDLLWVRLVVGVVGLGLLGLVALRWLRRRRTT